MGVPGEEAIAQYVAETMPMLPQLAPLGEYFSYNNTGFVVAGRIVEVVTGKSYRSALQDLIQEPLGLGRMPFQPEATSGGRVAIGHVATPDGIVVQEPQLFPRWLDPAGGLYGTSRELLAWARFHLGDGTVGGTRVLTAETLQAMQSPQGPAPIRLPRWEIGFSWFLQSTPTVRLVFHPGDTWGQHADLTTAPDRGFAFTMLANAQPVGAVVTGAAFAEALWQYLGLGGEAGMIGQENGMPAPPEPLNLPPATLDEYTGRYATPSEELTLSVEDGVLVMRGRALERPNQVRPRYNPLTPLAESLIMQEAVPLTFIREDIALAGEDPAAALPFYFVRGPDGRIDWLTSTTLRLVPRQE